MKFLFLNKNRLNNAIYICIFLLFSLCLNWKIIQEGIIFETPDLHIHINWLQHFSQQFNEGIFYPRWLAGTNYGYGSPTFVFYPPLVYYLGSVLIKLGVNTERTVVLLFVTAIFLSCFNFYLYAICRWDKLSSFIGALTYALMPYITYNITNRGALAETWAIALAPLGILAIDKAMASSKNLKWVSVFFFFISITHTPSLLIYTIFLFGYIIVLYRHQQAKRIVMIFLHAFIGFGIASIYLLPAILEQHLVQISLMKGVTGGWSNHIIKFPIDNRAKGHIFSFYLYSLASLFSLFFLCSYIDFKSSKKFPKRQTISWFILGIIVLFLMSYLSFPIWQTSSLLQMVQFPWRLMGIMSLSIAGLMTITVNNLIKIHKQNRYVIVKLVGVLMIAIILLWYSKYCYSLWARYDGFNNPGEFVESKKGKTPWKKTTFDRISIALNEPLAEKLNDVPEHLPKNSSAPLINQPPIAIINGEALISEIEWNSYKRSFKIDVLTKTSLVKVRTYYYPAWRLWINDQMDKIELAEDGTISFHLDQGLNKIRLLYTTTKSEKVAMFISLCSLLLLFVLEYLYSRQWKHRVNDC